MRNMCFFSRIVLSFFIAATVCLGSIAAGADKNSPFRDPTTVDPTNYTLGGEAVNTEIYKSELDQSNRFHIDWLNGLIDMVEQTPRGRSGKWDIYEYEVAEIADIGRIYNRMWTIARRNDGDFNGNGFIDFIDLFVASKPYAQNNVFMVSAFRSTIAYLDEKVNYAEELGLRNMFESLRQFLREKPPKRGKQK